MQIFIMYKSRKGTSQIGILEDPILIQWSKWTSSLMGQIKITHHLTGCSEKNIAPLLWLSCKRCITWNKSWGNIRHQIKEQLQNNWPVIFNIVKVIKVKERLKNCSRLEMTKSAITATCDSELDVFAVKSITKTLRKLGWSLKITWQSCINVDFLNYTRLSKHPSCLAWNPQTFQLWILPCILPLPWQ